MSNALAVEAPREHRFEQVGVIALYAMAAALQFSIAAAQILLALAALVWIAAIVINRERFEVPGFFWPLAAYAGVTIVSAAFSSVPRESFADTKQLALFFVVPIAYRFVTGMRGYTLMTVAVTAAAASAAIGIFQYAILQYDHLGQRPVGTLGHWMTYSGLLMLVVAIALARVLFGRGERMWAALVMPALAVGVAVTFTRSASVGVCAAAALLFALKDFRLFALAPLIAAIVLVAAPGQIQRRLASILDMKDATVRDRVAMLHVGERMIAAYPLTGVGPNMVERRYAEFRGPDAVNATNPHLHNVPLQIAAERGLIALGVWLWFIVELVRDVWARFKRSDNRFLPAAALASIAALVAAGLFEYNFGDSEVLMLFLITVTLPAAANRPASS